MADNEKQEETAPRANDWEVVSLTASTYAAAPGPVQLELNNVGNINSIKEDEAETSKAMLMSGHFSYPQKEPDKLHSEPESTEVSCIHENKDVISDVSADDGGIPKKKEDNNWKEIQFCNEMETSLPFDEVKFDGETTIEELNLIEKELSLYKIEPSALDEEIVGYGQVEFVEGEFDLDTSQLSIPEKEDESIVSGYPYEAWWKKHAAALYAQAKEANTFWSIFVAATVMGLVILRQHWQMESWQVLQLRWEVGSNNKKMGWMLSPLSRFKDVLVGGSREGLLTRSSFLANN